MATGWAYVNCTSDSGGGQADGPTGSVQFLTGTNSTSGSVKMVYHTASVGEHLPSTLVLSGNLVVTGTVSASVFHYRDVTRIDATGSTYFGDSTDDTHFRMGSLVVSASNAGDSMVLSASAHRQTVHLKGLNVLYESCSIGSYTASIPSYIIGVRHPNAVEIEIPPANNYRSGAILLIKDEVGHINGTNFRLSAATDTYTIDGSNHYILTGSNPAISLYSNGANWFVF
jgi:hypothetical protein